MNYSSLIGILVFAVLSTGDVLAEDAVDDSRAAVEGQRDATVREEMAFTSKEAAAFWPVYRDYRADVRVVMDRYTAVIREYMRRYDDADLTNEYADELMDAQFEVEKDLLDIRKRYRKKLGKILPALKVARFFQLENKMNVDIDMQLALSVPLIDPS